VKLPEGGEPEIDAGMNETEIPAGSPSTVAEGVSTSGAVPAIVGVSAEVRTPPTPGLTLPEFGIRVRLDTASTVDVVEVVVEEVEVLDELEELEELEEEEELDEEELVEVELEGSSASPISSQG